MPPSYSAIDLGAIQFTTRIDQRGYNRDRAALVADANRLSGQIGQSLNAGLSSSLRGLSGDVERQLVAGYANALRQIEQMTARSMAKQQRYAPAQQRQTQVLGGSFSNRAFDSEANKTGGAAGKAMAQGVAEGFSGSETFMRAAFDKSITKAILTADVLKFGLKKAIGGAMGTLPGQIAQIASSTLRGGGLQESINIQLESNTATSTLAALTNLDIQGAADQIDILNKRLAKSAAALPGETQQYKALANVLSDNLIGAFKDLNGELDTGGYVDSLAKISESYGALTASTTKDTGNTALALTRALGGASESQLRQFAFFEQNANALNQINQQLAKAGVESLADLTIEGRVKLLEAVGDTLITDDFKQLAENSVDGLLQSFRSALFDPTTGILGLNKDLDDSLEGTQSVFTSFNEVLRGLIGQSADDMGLLFRVAESAQAAGLNIGTPMMGQKRILDALAVSIEYAKTKTDDFFQAPAGQAIITILNGVQSAISSVLSSATGLKTTFVGAATVIGGPFGAAIGLILTNAERALPILQDVGGSLVGLFEAAQPYMQAFSDTLLEIIERAAPIVSGVLGGVASVLSGGGAGIGDAFGGVAESASGFIGGLGERVGGFSSGLSLPGGGEGQGGGLSLPPGLQAMGESLGPIFENVKLILGDIAVTIGNIVSAIPSVVGSLEPIAQALTGVVSSVTGAIAAIVDKFTSILTDSGALVKVFQTIADVIDGLRPGAIALAEILGEIVFQTVALLANDQVSNFLEGFANGLSKIAVGWAAIFDKFPLLGKMVGLIGIAAVTLPPIIAAVTAVGAGLISVGGVVASIVGGIGAVLALMNPVTLAIAGTVAAVVGISFAIKALLPSIKETWGNFKEASGNALNSAKDGMLNLWAKTDGLRDRMSNVNEKFKSGAVHLWSMVSNSKAMAGPLEAIKKAGGAIVNAFKSALGVLGDIGKKIVDMFDFIGSMGQGGGGEGGSVQGVFRSGLFTGPSANIGGSSAYHIDTKILRSASIEQQVAIFDKMAEGYAAIGKRIEFSNRAVAGEIYNADAAFKEKADLLRRASAAHSHSVSQAYDSFDYYIPDIGKNRHDRSAEGAEMLLPNLPGGRVEYNSGGRYGNYAILYDAQGQALMKTGHGDDRRALPQSQAFSAAPQGDNRRTPSSYQFNRSANTAPGSSSSTGAGGGGSQEQAAWNFFKSQGYSDAMAAAMVGTIRQESGFRSNVPGDGGKAMGIMQWHSNRRDSSFPYADFQGQLAYADREFRGPNGSIAGGRRFDPTVTNVAEAQAIVDAALRFGHRGNRNEYTKEALERYGGTGVTGNGALPDRRTNNYTPEQQAARDRLANGGSPSSIAASSSAGADVDVDLSQYINPSEAAKRALAEAEVMLKRTAEVRGQARSEEDRQFALDREMRRANLEKEISELDPENTTAAALLNYEEKVLTIDEAMGDRLRQNERQLEDLRGAQTLKIRQMEALESNRTAYTDAMARGIDTGGITEESLKQQAAAISAIDYSSAIKELEGYSTAMKALAEPQLAVARNELLKILDSEIEKTEDLVLATTALNQQYTDVSSFEKYVTQQAKITMAYADQAETLEVAISSLTQLATVEGLSAEKLAELTAQRIAAEAALNGLAAAQERATVANERAYNRQQEDEQLAGFERIAASRLQLMEMEAKAIQRFDPEGATDIRRQAASFELVLKTQKIARDITREQEDAITAMNQAIAEGNTAWIEMQAQIGMGSIEAINTTYSGMLSNATEMARLETMALAEQFPTVAESFRTTVRDSFAGGFKEGILNIANGGGFFESIGNIFEGIGNAVMEKGAQRASDFLTAKLFGNGDQKGWLDGLFGANEDSIPGQGKSAAAYLEEGGQQAGLRLLEGGESAGESLVLSADIAASKLEKLLAGIKEASELSLSAVSEGAGSSRAEGTGLGNIFNPKGNEQKRSVLDFIFDPKGGGDEKSPFFKNAGITLGKTFAEEMPKAGKSIGGNFFQTLTSSIGGGGGIFGKITSGISGLFGGGGGGGGGFFGTIGNILGGLFYNGGFVENYAMGGIGAAMSRERVQSGGRQPRLIVANADEFILSGDATQSLLKNYGPEFLESLNRGIVPNYAGGGFANSLQPAATRSVSAGSGMQQRSVGGSQRFVFEYQLAGNQRFVEASQLERMQEQINSKATAGESVEATFELIKNYPEVRQDLGFRD